jgi:hypothetical protein
MSAQPYPIVQRQQASLDPDVATAETIEVMKRHIADAQRDPALFDACRKALALCGLGASIEEKCQAIFAWIKSRVAFKGDDALIQSLFNERDQLELLISPSVLLRMERAQGDCDDFTMLCCAMMQLCGIGCEIVTLAADPNDPTRFSHVYCEAVTPEGRIPMDTSHGTRAGWHVPLERQFRRQEWPVAGAQPKRWAGLHGYVPRHRRRRGMGDTVDLSGTMIADPGLTTPVYTTDPSTWGLPTGAITPTITPASTAPSGWTTLMNDLTGAFKSSVPLIQQAINPVGGYVQTGPGGTVISNNVPGAVPGSVLGTGFSSASLSSLMPILLLAGGAIFLFSMLGKK